VPFFAYKGRNARGELMQGVLEAADSGAVADQLFNTGVTPIEIVVTKGRRRWRNLVGQAAGKEGHSMDVQLFSRQMYTLLKSGVPIMRGLAGLQESAVSKAFGKVIKDLRESLDAGRELSAAMRRHPEVFTPFYLSMVRVGEMTGRLEEVFLRLFDHLEFDRDMRERVKTATRYPTFVVIAMVIAMIVVNMFVIPAFVGVFAKFGAELPLMTRILIGTSNFTVRYWPVLAAAARWASGAFARMATPKGLYQWDKFKLRIPVAGKIVLKATMARFARSFRAVQPQRRADCAGLDGGGADGGQRLPDRARGADARRRRARREHPAHGGSGQCVHADCAADDRGGRGERFDRRPDGRDRADV
jgi:MSHA biogenesis protein MshG